MQFPADTTPPEEEPGVIREQFHAAVSRLGAELEKLKMRFLGAKLKDGGSEGVLDSKPPGPRPMSAREPPERSEE